MPAFRRLRLSWWFLCACLAIVRVHAEDDDDDQTDPRYAIMGGAAKTEMQTYFDQHPKLKYKTSTLGLKYRVLEESTKPDARVCCSSCRCDVHWEMYALRKDSELLHGTERNKGEVETCKPGDDACCPGVTEAIKMMKEGAKWELILTPDLGYGFVGNHRMDIAPFAPLRVVVQLVEVRDAPAKKKLDYRPADSLGRWKYTDKYLAEMGKQKACAACLKVAGYMKDGVKKYSATKGIGKNKKKRRLLIQVVWGEICNEKVIPPLGLYNQTGTGWPAFYDDREGYILGYAKESFKEAFDNSNDVHEHHRQEIIGLCAALRDTMKQATANAAARYDGRIVSFPHNYWLCSDEYTGLCDNDRNELMEDYSEDAWLDPKDLPAVDTKKTEL